MFKIYFINSGCWYSETFPQLRDAINLSKQKGLETTIYENDTPVGNWTLAYGYRNY